uniref:Secreted protein n=1 Tax=Strongyloides stercoralis TaxID=6248 RepID=A0A0K0EJ01_STRER
MKLFILSITGTILLTFILLSIFQLTTTSPINDYLKADFEEDQLFILRKPSLAKGKPKKVAAVVKSTTKKVPTKKSVAKSAKN